MDVDIEFKPVAWAFPSEWVTPCERPPIIDEALSEPAQLLGCTVPVSSLSGQLSPFSLRGTSRPEPVRHRQTSPLLNPQIQRGHVLLMARPVELTVSSSLMCAGATVCLSTCVRCFNKFAWRNGHTRECVVSPIQPRRIYGTLRSRVKT
jgi:hypothetical protein